MLNSELSCARRGAWRFFPRRSEPTRDRKRVLAIAKGSREIADIGIVDTSRCLTPRDMIFDISEDLGHSDVYLARDDNKRRVRE